MNSKTKKILGIVSNVLVVVILAFVVLITFSIILSRGQGKNYTALFGRSYVAVQSDSMERDSYDDFVYPHDVEGFKKGDLIQIRVLSFEERGNLKVGDVVSYRFDIDGDGEKNELNTHRIVAYTDSNMDGVIDYYTLQGDKVGAPLDQNIPANTTIYTSPKLRPGKTYKMMIGAKVNGKWDLTNVNSRSFTVTIK